MALLLFSGVAYGQCVLTFSSTDATCGTCADGTATVYPDTFSTNTFTYLWDDPLAQTTQTATNLNPGMYCVTVTYPSTGCVVTGCVNVGQSGAGCAVTVSATDASSANTMDGTATAIPDSSGTPPYTYVWSNGELTASINNLAAGTYCVTLMDANGCTATACGMVGPGTTTPCSIALTGTNISCNTCTDGAASVTASGGTAPYTYSWNTGALTSSINNLAAGTYCVTVTDADTCAVTDCITIGSNSNTGCLASFYPYVDSSQANLVYLIENSTGTGLSYYWDFDDGNTSTQQYPTHVYSNYGTYNICLTVSDTSNCVNTTCLTLVLDSVPKTGTAGYTVMVVPSIPLSVYNIPESDRTSHIYPNPASSGATIELNGWEGTATISLFNIMGQSLHQKELVLNSGTNIIHLKLHEYTEGLHFIQVESEGERQTKKLTIIK